MNCFIVRISFCDIHFGAAGILLPPGGRALFTSFRAYYIPNKIALSSPLLLPLSGVFPVFYSKSNVFMQIPQNIGATFSPKTRFSQENPAQIFRLTPSKGVKNRQNAEKSEGGPPETTGRPRLSAWTGSREHSFRKEKAESVYFI